MRYDQFSRVVQALNRAQQKIAALEQELELLRFERDDALELERITARANEGLAARVQQLANPTRPDDDYAAGPERCC